jgi:hypothetical protein
MCKYLSLKKYLKAFLENIYHQDYLIFAYTKSHEDILVKEIRIEVSKVNKLVKKNYFNK